MSLMKAILKFIYILYRAEPHISVRYPPYTPAITEELIARAGIIRTPAPKVSL